MKKILRKLGAFFLSAAMLASLVVNAAAVDAGTGVLKKSELDPPTTVSAGYSSYDNAITLSFGEDSVSAGWLNAITGVKVDETSYTKANSSYFLSTNEWIVANVIGAYGSYSALKLCGSFDNSFPVVISADGYSDLTVELTTDGNGGYTAEIKDSGDGGETGENNPTEKKAPPTEFTYPAYSFGSDFKLIFSSEDAEWLNAITGVTVDNKTWSEGLVWGNQAYSVVARTNEMDGCYIEIGSGFLPTQAICVISADGYSDLTLKLNKNDRTAEVVNGATEPEEVYSITVEEAEHGTVTASSETAKEGEVITVTVQPNTGYELDTLTVTQGDEAVNTESIDDGYTFVMPAGDVTVSAVFRAAESSGELLPPATVTAKYNYSSLFTSTVYLDFGQDAGTRAWLEKIIQVNINGSSYTHESSLSWGAEKAWTVGTDTNSTTMPTVLQLTENFTAPATVVISAEGYKDLTVTLTKTGSGSDAQYAAEIGNGGSTEPEPGPEKEISLDKIKIADDADGITPASCWYFTFEDAPDYIAAITSVSVNDESWESKTSAPSSGGAYYPDAENGRLVFAITNYSSSGPDTLKSGDVITIKATGYQDLEFKFVLDQKGENPSVEENDGQGDHYQLHVKLVGSFEAAIVGQEDYDGVSGATGGSSTNQNSNVTVYGALMEKGTEPGEDDWAKLDQYSSDIDIDGSKCFVSIVPDVANGTPADSNSGMEGVYMTISSALTLSGTPEDPGSYLISITVADEQGRTATSNTLPFRIYTGEETLAERLQLENLTQTQDGKYMWDIMEPWAIRNFGSNVDGEENSVRVPQEVKAWYGSHTSGTYGYLGYDIPWDDVVADKIPQTLYIPSGCDLTFVNMEILSSVRIVVENGGKLTLQDSVVQGIIEVEDGGTFFMNYNGYGGEGEFLTGSSLCGQLRLEDGAILENAAIYSHINYLANGDLTDRTSNEPVVVATGNVTVRGQVFIQGDEAGDNKIAQTGLRVQNGTLTVEDGAVLVVYGGDATVQLFPTSGTAIQLDNGTITGGGKVVAVAGKAFWGSGGIAVSGNGAISTAEAFLQGATAHNTWSDTEAGKAVSGNISVTSPSRHVKDGTVIGTLESDPLEELYWKSGIDPMPPLDKFLTKAAVSIVASTSSLRGGGMVTLTVNNAEGDVSVKQTDDNGGAEKILTAGADGAFSVNLPNQTATYTFTATAENGTAQCTVSVTRKSSGGSSSGGSSITTTTEKNEDGSITTTVTNKKTGTVTETTKYADGSTLVVKSEADGTVTTTETRADNVTIRTVDEPGKDVEVTVTLPQDVDETVVTVPIDADYGMVAVDADTGEIVSLSVPTEDGLMVNVDGTMNLVIVDNAKDFKDTNGHWAEDAIDFAAAHEFFAGVTEDTFAPDSPMTRAMLVTVLARFDGQDTTGGSVWYETAITWAKENGISDGSNPNGQITREQLAAMLYRYAASKGYDTAPDSVEIQNFADYDAISEYAEEALVWAVDAGIMRGTSSNTLSPGGSATRAQVATILMRFCEYIVEQ